MDQEFIDNKKTKDLAQINTIPAIELPSLKIINSLSHEDSAFIEHEIIPYSLLKQIENKFSMFSEEWVEIFNGEEKKETSLSAKIDFKFFHLQGQNFTFQNKLISNTYKSIDNYQIKVNEARKELILTDGEIIKNEKKILKTADEFFTETYQDLEVLNASYLVILDREKRTNPYGRWEHHDEIQIYMTDRVKIDYLRMYLGSNSNVSF